MSKRTLFLIFALFIITFVLLLVALYKPTPKPLPVPTPVVKEPVAQTVLTFGDLAVATPSSVAGYSLPVNIATRKNKVTAVQLELQYDPQILTAVSVAPGPFFTNPVELLNQIDAKTGRISYAFGIQPTGQGVTGNGVAATFTFKTLTRTPQPTSIIFLPKTLVTAEGMNQTALKTTKNALFTVGVTSPSATNKPSPISVP